MELPGPAPSSQQHAEPHAAAEDAAPAAERRRRQRLLRQKRAKALKRAAVQESSQHNSSEDEERQEHAGLEEEYEQHLRRLQQLHSAPAPAPPAAPQQGAPPSEQQQQQQQSGGKKRGAQQQQQQGGHSTGGGRGAKRRRRSGRGVPAGEAGSVDTLASEALLSVPAAHPRQQLAQISELSGQPQCQAAALPAAEAFAPAAAAAPTALPLALAAQPASASAAAAFVAGAPVIAWQPLAWHPAGAAGSAGSGPFQAALPVLVWQPVQLGQTVPHLLPASAAGLAAAGLAACAPLPQQQQGQGQQGQQGQDALAMAALLEEAVVQQQAACVVDAAAGKTAGICRVDLSATALLIGGHLAPAAAAGGGQQPFAADEPAGAPAVSQQVVAGLAGVESAAAVRHAAQAPGQQPRQQQQQHGMPVEVEEATEAAAAGTSGTSGGKRVSAAAPDDAEPAGAGAGGSARQGKRRIYVHGNYHRYYGYRVFNGLPGSSGDAQQGTGPPSAAAAAGSSASEQQQAPAGEQGADDPRLSVLQRGWFARRRCLDVGCNEGVVTLALVRRFHPASMLGVDIDGTLVGRANRHLRDLRRAAGERLRASRLGGVAPEERKAARLAADALGATRFACADFLDSEVEAGSLDTISCLSVTKWIHLNRGDDGLRALFAAFWRALARGGLLLLEPQPWSSYRAAGGKVKRHEAPPGSFFHRLDELRLRPDAFADFLCDELGFRLVRRLGAGEGSAAAGFDRPMLLLRKPA